MKVCYISGYWGKNSDRVLGRRPDEYLQAYRYVHAVKSGSHLMDFWVSRQNGNKQWITTSNFTSVRRWFGLFVEQSVAANGWDGALLVHVPSKNAVTSATMPRSLDMLIEAMAQTNLAGLVTDALRWTTKLGPSHEGGERRRRELSPHLVVTQPVAGHDIVLVDDLLTRGGNMLACKDVLEAAGANVVGGVTCGHTMYDRSIQAFGRQAIELNDELSDLGRLTGGPTPPNA